jgi:hypothetical protein
MNISKSVFVQLTEDETYAALEEYIRQRFNLVGYEVDDADSSCSRDGKGAYFIFLKREE